MSLAYNNNLNAPNNFGSPYVQYLTEPQDLNNITKSGYYLIHSIEGNLNLPSSCVDGWLQVLKSNDRNVVKQIFYRWGTNNSNDMETWVRTRNPAQDWSNWFELSLSKWVSKGLTITSADTVIKSNETKTYSLASYLPNDGNVYDVTFSVVAECTGSNNTYSLLNLKTDLIQNLVQVTRTNQGMSKYGASSVTLPVGKDRKVYISRNSTSLNEGTAYFGLYVHCYRKAR